MMSTKIIRWYLWALCFFAVPSLAGDLSVDVRKGTSSPSDSNFIDVGLGVAVGKAPIYGLPEGNVDGETLTIGYVEINARVQYKGFFLEAFSQSLEDFALGYNFLSTDKWSLDVVSLQEHPALDPEENDDYEGLKERKGDYMLGPRATAYFGKYIVQVNALTDISGVHDGKFFSVKVARHWQYKNWNYHAILATSYRSQAIADYYFSVDAEDANEKFPEFQARSGFNNVVEIGATYPISQKWVFRGFVRHFELNSQWDDSPLIVTTHPTMVAASVNYVF